MMHRSQTEKKLMTMDRVQKQQDKLRAIEYEKTQKKFDLLDKINRADDNYDKKVYQQGTALKYLDDNSLFDMKERAK